MTLQHGKVSAATSQRQTLAWANRTEFHLLVYFLSFLIIKQLGGHWRTLMVAVLRRLLWRMGWLCIPTIALISELPLSFVLKCALSNLMTSTYFLRPVRWVGTEVSTCDLLVLIMSSVSTCELVVRVIGSLKRVIGSNLGLQPFFLNK